MGLLLSICVLAWALADASASLVPVGTGSRYAEVLLFGMWGGLLSWLLSVWTKRQSNAWLACHSKFPDSSLTLTAGTWGMLDFGGLLLVAVVSLVYTAISFFEPLLDWNSVVFGGAVSTMLLILLGFDWLALKTTVIINHNSILVLEWTGRGEAPTNGTRISLEDIARWEVKLLGFSIDLWTKDGAKHSFSTPGCNPVWEEVTRIALSEAPIKSTDLEGAGHERMG
ncbi:MAG: hypothetical protein GHCLOJNM_02755 [bacterium]|nr:hypothetical protein [bacterium]